MGDIFDKNATKSQTSTTTVPDYVSNASEDLVSRAVSRADRGPTPYKGNLVAGFNADQRSAFQMLRDLASKGSGVSDEVMGLVRDYAKAPGQEVSTERIVDEDGKLGAIGDYLNPYVENALNPAIRRIMEAADKQRNQIGASATSAGAFGDARHGIRDSRLNQDTSTAVGDTASNFMMQAFEQAMGKRQSDLNRFLDVDKTNATYGERELDRMLTGARELPAAAMSELPFIQQLLGVGNTQQGQGQRVLDSRYNEFLRQQNDEYNLLNSLASALGSARYDVTQTSESSEPDNWIADLIGSGTSAYLGSTAGSAALSTLLAGI